MRAFFLCLLAAATLAQEAAQPPLSAYVLTSETYDAATASGKWFIKYYGACDLSSEQTRFQCFRAAPWCGACKAMAGAWSEFAALNNVDGSDVTVAELDCTEAGGKDEY